MHIVTRQDAQSASPGNTRSAISRIAHVQQKEKVYSPIAAIPSAAAQIEYGVGRNVLSVQMCSQQTVIRSTNRVRFVGHGLLPLHMIARRLCGKHTAPAPRYWARYEGEPHH